MFQTWFYIQNYVRIADRHGFWNSASTQRVHDLQQQLCRDCERCRHEKRRDQGQVSVRAQVADICHQCADCPSSALQSTDRQFCFRLASLIATTEALWQMSF